MKSKYTLTYVSLSLALFASALWLHPAHAQNAQAGLYSRTGALVHAIPNIPTGASLATVDYNGDGTQDIVVGSPAGTPPNVRILTSTGKVLKDFPLRSVKNSPAVHVNVGNVQGDTAPEIVVSFGPGTTPEIWLLSLQGAHLRTFFAYDKKFHSGVTTALGDLNGDGLQDIVTAPETGGGPNVKAFDGMGVRLANFSAYPNTVRTGISVTTTDVNNDGVSEILTTAPISKSLVKIFTVNGVLLQSFSAANFTPRTLHMASLNSSQLLMGSAAGTPAEVTSYNTDGSIGDVHFFPFGKSYLSGVSVATYLDAPSQTQEILLAPGASEETTGSGNGKKIVVSLSQQKLYQYQNGVLIGTHDVSTGKASSPTPTGTYTIHNKMTTAYSRPFHLFMDHWMAITPDGAYGIHSLPYWRLKNGGVLYEGVGHLGRKVSNGCIRLSPQEATTVYAWATVGTQVVVKN